MSWLGTGGEPNSPGIGECADAYGWSDTDLDDSFWDTPQGRRFTLGLATRPPLRDATV